MYVAFLGPLTDMASAILLDPAIVDRPVTVIWIGGEGHDDLGLRRKMEFNLSNDIAAANVVFDSGITLWQVPRSVYPMVSVSYTELEEKIAGTSELADYLIRQLKEWNAAYHPGPIESRSLGDSPAVSLLLYPQSGVFRTVPAPAVRGRRVTTSRVRAIPCRSASPSTCGSCSRTCSPSSAGSVPGSRPSPSADRRSPKGHP